MIPACVDPSFFTLPPTLLAAGIGAALWLFGRLFGGDDR
jgi:hypothetical protein